MPKSSTIDYGKPPDALLRQESKVHSLLSTDAPTTVPGALLDSAAADQKVATPVASPEPSVPISMGRQVNLNTERVELEYIPDKPDVPAFRLGFTVGEVCVRDNYVSMLIISDIGFNPTTTMKFDLKYRGKVIPVIFAGAEFEFQTVGIRGISFLVDRNRKDKPAGSTTKWLKDAGMEKTGQVRPGITPSTVSGLPSTRIEQDEPVREGETPVDPGLQKLASQLSPKPEDIRHE